MWLALDTATDRATVALGDGERVLAQETVVGARRHAAQLLPALELGLARIGAGYSEIEAIVLADGPGSFTGLRVGATVARALVRVRPMPLWVAPSLLVCAAGVAAGTEGTVVAVSNALRGDLFVAAYRFHPGRVETRLAPAVLRPEQIPGRVPDSARITGPAAGTLGGEPAWPEAGRLLALVGVAGAVRRIPDPAGWEPDYGRPAEAQAKWEREHGRPLADPASRAG